VVAKGTRLKPSFPVRVDVFCVWKVCRPSEMTDSKYRSLTHRLSYDSLHFVLGMKYRREVLRGELKLHSMLLALFLDARLSKSSLLSYA
jgi:hypothetical protein